MNVPGKQLSPPNTQQLMDRDLHFPAPLVDSFECAHAAPQKSPSRTGPGAHGSSFCLSSFLRACLKGGGREEERMSRAHLTLCTPKTKYPVTQRGPEQGKTRVVGR